MGFNDVVFGRIDDPFQTILQVSTDAVEHAFSGSLTFHQNGKISIPVGVNILFA